MPKSLPPTGRSKVRFFFVEADLAPGEMHQLTTALSSAIRPGSQIRRTELLAAELAPMKAEAEPAIDDVELESSTEEAPEATDETETRSPRGPRKYRSPRPVNDLDMEAGGKPFEKFAIEKGSPPDHVARYLVAAAWLDQCAKVSPVTVDHIFTCYTSAGWTYDPKDPGFPFRRLKKQGLGDTSKGAFKINHLGHAEVKKMSGPQA
jgi:hypothetical protein